MNLTFTAADQRSPTITLLGPCTLIIDMAGSNTVLLQARIGTSWVTFTDGTFTADGVVAIEPAGVPLVVSLTQSVHAADTVINLTGKFLADEISTQIAQNSFLLETADVDDLLMENGDYLLLEAA